MSAPAFEYVQLVVGSGPTADFGLKLDKWLNYEVTQSIFQPGHFSFRLGLAGQGGAALSRDDVRRIMRSTRADTVVRLEQGERRTLLFRGIIDRQFIGGGRSEEYVDITGRDAGQVLQDNEAQCKSIAGKTLPQLAEEILSRYRGKGIPFNVVASADANRDILTGKQKGLAAKKQVRTAKGKAPVQVGSGKTGGTPIGFTSQSTKDARPHPGETEWAFLERHAKNLGVLMYFGAEGDLIFTAPDYSQPALYEFRRRLVDDPKAPNNILDGGRAFDTANTASAVHIYGHTEGRGEDRTQVTATATIVDEQGNRVSVSKATAKAAKPAYGKAVSQSVWPRERTIRDAHARSGDTAVKLAQRELAQRAMNFETYEYTLADHESEFGVPYAIDAQARVIDEIADVDATVYLTERTIRKSRAAERATTTTMKGVPKGAIVL